MQGTPIHGCPTECYDGEPSVVLRDGSLAIGTKTAQDSTLEAPFELPKPKWGPETGDGNRDRPDDSKTAVSTGSFCLGIAKRLVSGPEVLRAQVQYAQSTAVAAVVEA